jgi:hypothetical protein
MAQSGPTEMCAIGMRDAKQPRKITCHQICYFRFQKKKPEKAQKPIFSDQTIFSADIFSTEGISFGRTKER